MSRSDLVREPRHLDIRRYSTPEPALDFDLLANEVLRFDGEYSKIKPLRKSA
jgi:hypothetical protein